LLLDSQLLLLKGKLLLPQVGQHQSTRIVDPYLPEPRRRATPAHLHAHSVACPTSLLQPAQHSLRRPVSRVLNRTTSLQLE
jgi:hypothetical protein